jgi:hypothetical protein
VGLFNDDLQLQNKMTMIIFFQLSVLVRKKERMSCKDVDGSDLGIFKYYQRICKKYYGKSQTQSG